MPALIRCLERKSESCRYAAIDLLAELGAHSPPAVEALIQVLRVGSPRDKASAARALKQLPDRGLVAASVLSSLLGDPAGLVRSEAARALGEIGPGAKGARPELVRALADEEARDQAARTLVALGPDAYPDLIAGLADPDPEVRLAVVTALEDVGRAEVSPTVMVRPLLRSLEDPVAEIRGAAATALASFRRESSPELVSALIRVARQDPDLDTRVAAIWALGSIGPLAPGPARAEAAIALAELLSDDGPEGTCEDASAALGEFEGRAAPAISVLGDHLWAEEGAEALAAETLAVIGHASREEGTLWWALPRVFWRQGAAVLLFTVGCLGCGRALQRRARLRRVRKALLFAGLVLSTGTAAGGLALYVVTRPWAEGFLPSPFLSQVPLPLTAVFSVLFLCLLGATWAVSVEPRVADESPMERPGAPPA